MGGEVMFCHNSAGRFGSAAFHLLCGTNVEELILAFTAGVLSGSMTTLSFFFPGHGEVSSHFSIVCGKVSVGGLSRRSGGRLLRSFDLPSSTFVINRANHYGSTGGRSAVLGITSSLYRERGSVRFMLINGEIESGCSVVIRRVKLSKRVRLLNCEDSMLHVLPLFSLCCFPSLASNRPGTLVSTVTAKLPFITSSVTSVGSSIPMSVRSLLLSPYSASSTVGVVSQVCSNSVSGSGCEYGS